MKKPVPLSHIQRKAKQLKKENPKLNHHQALDESSRSFGHANFKNYKNDVEAYNKWLTVALEDGADFAMNEQNKEMMARFNLVNPTFESFQLPIHDLISSFKKEKPSDEEVQSACDRELTLKKYIELFFLKDSLDDIDWDLVTHAPYHIPESATVKNLVFRYGKNYFDDPTNDELLYVEGEYEILCKVMFGHTREDIDARNDGFFDDCRLTGFFELTIDKNKNITLGDTDISCDW